MTAASYGDVHGRLLELANPKHAEVAQRYFKTGPGEYGEGDKFLGIRVPVVRRVAREFDSLPMAGVMKLLKSPWHEERLLAVLMLVRRYDQGSEGEREAI